VIRFYTRTTPSLWKALKRVIVFATTHVGRRLTTRVHNRSCKTLSQRSNAFEHLVMLHDPHQSFYERTIPDVIILLFKQDIRNAAKFRSDYRQLFDCWGGLSALKSTWQALHAPTSMKNTQENLRSFVENDTSSQRDDEQCPRETTKQRTLKKLFSTVRQFTERQHRTLDQKTTFKDKFTASASLLHSNE